MIDVEGEAKSFLVGKVIEEGEALVGNVIERKECVSGS